MVIKVDFAQLRGTIRICHEDDAQRVGDQIYCTRMLRLVKLSEGRCARPFIMEPCIGAGIGGSVVLSSGSVSIYVYESYSFTIKVSR